MRQRGLRGLSLPARGVQAALERGLSRPPAGGWFPSLPLRQRAGRFLPPLFPITRRRGRNLPADARSVRSRQDGRAALALTEDTVTITPTAEATGAAKPAMSKGQLRGAQTAAVALPRGGRRTVRHRPRRMEG